MGFWDKALQGTAPVVATVRPPMHPVQPLPAMTSGITRSPNEMPYPRDHVPAPSKAVSARSNATCYECGSDYIFKPHGQPNAMEQCYNCGWNPRFAHSTAGAGMPSDNSAPTRASRQVSTANNFNPQTIVAKVGT